MTSRRPDLARARRSGWAHAGAALAARLPGAGRRAASPTPGVRAAPSPPRRRSEHTAGMTWLVRVARTHPSRAPRGARRARRPVRLRRADLRRGRPRRRRCSIGRTDAPDLAPLRARHRRRRPGVRPGADPARGLRRPAPSRAVGPRRTTCCGGSPETVDGRLPGGGAAGPDGPGARRGHRAPRGRRCGWSWTTGRRSPRPGRRARRTRRPDGRPVRRSDHGPPGPSGAATAASCSACLVVQERRGRAADRRSRNACSPGWPPRPGWCCAARGCAPSSSCAPPSCPPGPTSCGVSRERLVDAQDDERRRLERDIHDGAQQHLVALAVNLRLAAHPGRARRRSAPTRCSPRRRTRPPRPSTTLVRLSRGIYPPLLEEEGVGAALRSRDRRLRPGRSRSSSAAVGRYPATRRGGGVLLLPGGAPERRQARRARPRSGSTLRRDAGRPGARRSRTTARASTRRHARRAPAWRTSATGSSRWAGRSRTDSAPGRGHPGPRRAPRPHARDRGRRWLTCAPGSPGCWPASRAVVVVADVVVSAQAVAAPLGDRDRRARLPVRPRRRRSAPR